MLYLTDYFNLNGHFFIGKFSLYYQGFGQSIKNLQAIYHVFKNLFILIKLFGKWKTFFNFQLDFLIV
jgi:hypothetical protein